MGTVVALSSWVARGSVGLRAIVPAIESLGHEAIACPTVVLSNHPGHPHGAGRPVAAETLADMLAALDANGWLARADAVLTGYLPTEAHVAVAEDLVVRVRAHRPEAEIVCDPVLGDDPEGLYLPEAVGEAVRRRLVPLATVLTPNRFELAYLSGRPAATVSEAVAAARVVGVPAVLATSIPAGPDRLANVAVAPGRAAQCEVARRPSVPHGTGDLLAALTTGRLIEGVPLFESLAWAAAGVERAIAESGGGDELRFGPALGDRSLRPAALGDIAPA